MMFLSGFYCINLIRSIFAEVGVSDEGFLLIQVNGRSLEGIKDWYLPYTDFLVPLWNLSGNELPLFRTFGLVVYLVILVPTFVLLANKPQARLSIISLVTLFCLSGLGLSRYLLVTPGYQYLTLVFSVGAVVPVLYLLEVSAKKRSPLKGKELWVVLFLSISELIIFSSRITGGLIFFLIISVLLLSTTNQFTTIKKLTLIALPVSIFIILDINYWQDRIQFIYSVTQLIDSKNYSILSESIDITKPMIPLLFSFLIALISVSKEKNSGSRWMILLTTLWVITILAQINRLGLISISILFFILSRKLVAEYSIKVSIQFLSVALIPYLTVFGSNTPAVGNYPNLLIGLVLVFLYTRRFAGNREATPPTDRVEFSQHLFTFLALMLLAYIAISSQISGYGKNLPDMKITSLTKSSIPSNIIITDLGNHHLTDSPRSPLRILDLTYFNPGLIYHLQGLPYPISLSYGSRDSNLDLALSAIRESIKEFGVQESGVAPYVLVRVRPNLDQRCYSLALVTADDKLSAALKKFGWNNKYSIQTLITNKEEDLQYGLLKACVKE